MVFNRRGDLAECRLSIDALPGNQARLYIVYHISPRSTDESHERRIRGLHPRYEREKGMGNVWIVIQGGSGRKMGRAQYFGPKSYSAKTIHGKTSQRQIYQWNYTPLGEGILYTLRTNRFQEEPSDSLLEKASSAAKKFPNYNQARRFVNSVVISRLTENEVHVIGWVQEVKAINGEKVLKMAKTVDNEQSIWYGKQRPVRNWRLENPSM